MSSDLKCLNLKEFKKQRMTPNYQNSASKKSYIDLVATKLVSSSSSVKLISTTDHFVLDLAFPRNLNC